MLKSAEINAEIVILSFLHCWLSLRLVDKFYKLRLQSGEYPPALKLNFENNLQGHWVQIKEIQSTNWHLGERN